MLTKRKFDMLERAPRMSTDGKRVEFGTSTAPIFYDILDSRGKKKCDSMYESRYYKEWPNGFILSVNGTRFVLFNCVTEGVHWMVDYKIVGVTCIIPSDREICLFIDIKNEGVIDSLISCLSISRDKLEIIRYNDRLIFPQLVCKSYESLKQFMDQFKLVYTSSFLTLPRSDNVRDIIMSIPQEAWKYTSPEDRILVGEKCYPNGWTKILAKILQDKMFFRKYPWAKNIKFQPEENTGSLLRIKIDDDKGPCALTGSKHGGSQSYIVLTSSDETSLEIEGKCYHSTCNSLMSKHGKLYIKFGLKNTAFSLTVTTKPKSGKASSSTIITLDLQNLVMKLSEMLWPHTSDLIEKSVDVKNDTKYILTPSLILGYIKSVDWINDKKNLFILFDTARGLNEFIYYITMKCPDVKDQIYCAQSDAIVVDSKYRLVLTTPKYRVNYEHVHKVLVFYSACTKYHSLPHKEVYIFHKNTPTSKKFISNIPFNGGHVYEPTLKSILNQSGEMDRVSKEKIKFRNEYAKMIANEPLVTDIDYDTSHARKEKYMLSKIYGTKTFELPLPVVAPKQMDKMINFIVEYGFEQRYVQMAWNRWVEDYAETDEDTSRWMKILDLEVGVSRTVLNTDLINQEEYAWIVSWSKLKKRIKLPTGFAMYEWLDYFFENVLEKKFNFTYSLYETSKKDNEYLYKWSPSPMKMYAKSKLIGPGTIKPTTKLKPWAIDWLNKLGFASCYSTSFQTRKYYDYSWHSNGPFLSTQLIPILDEEYGEMYSWQRECSLRWVYLPLYAKNVKCSLCPCSLSCKEELREHNALNHNIGTQKCPLCNHHTFVRRQCPNELADTYCDRCFDKTHYRHFIEKEIVDKLKIQLDKFCKENKITFTFIAEYESCDKKYRPDVTLVTDTQKINVDIDEIEHLARQYGCGFGKEKMRMDKIASDNPKPGPPNFIRYNPSEYDTDEDKGCLDQDTRYQILVNECKRLLVNPPPKESSYIYICYSKKSPRIVPSGIILGH
jgi:hypothetical protein